MQLRAIVTGAAFAIALAAQGLACLAAEPASGPFGIRIGEPISALGPVKQGGDKHSFQVLHPTGPLVDFPLVLVSAYPGTGVCQIIAKGPSIENDPNGSKVRRDVDRLSAALTAKYGDAKIVDTCTDPSGDCSGDYPGLLNGGVAKYAYTWEDAPAATSLRIWRIALLAESFDGVSTSVGLIYFGDNHEACDAAEAAAEGSGL